MRELESKAPSGRKQSFDTCPHPPLPRHKCLSFASPLPLLGLKQTPAATAAPQVIAKDAPPARAIVLLLWGCLSVLRSVRQVGLPRLMLGEGLMLEEGLMVD